MTDPYWVSADGDVQLHLGDCLDVLRALPADSVDAIVTDPPYNLSDGGTRGFMGREWDGLGSPASFQHWCEQWAREALRVLKPGGHMLAFGGTRTWHRLVCGIEDAGFEIRDCVADLTGQDAPGLMWIHGQGFPKSRDIGKDIDRMAGAEREVIGEGDRFGRGAMHARSRAEAGYRPTERNPDGGTSPITAPATEEARRWDGFGTALKPAWEPVALARKPLQAGSVAGNVLRWGTGALNIAACKVEGAGAEEGRVRHGGGTNSTYAQDEWTKANQATMGSPMSAGRWPANVVLTHSASCEPAGTRRVRGSKPGAAGGKRFNEQDYAQDGYTQAMVRSERQGYADADGMETVAAWRCAADCPVGELDRQSGVLTSGTGAVKRASAKGGTRSASIGAESRAEGTPMLCYGDTGGASRFYPVFRYQAKAPASERPRLDDGTAHETVKPLGFISWAVRLITPPGGTVLDLFGGSGPVAEACIIEGFRAVIIERERKSADLIVKRLSKPIQPVMFGVGDEAV